MSPLAKEGRFAAAAGLLAVSLATGIAEESYTAALAVCGALLLLVTARFSSPRLEAWILAAALAGYILGNRSFAQLSLIGRLPVLPAEAAMLGCLILIGYRSARGQAKGLVHDPVNFAVIAWLFVGSVRIWPDFQRHGFMAVRDYAVIYYAFFFFAAQALASHGPSLRLLQRTIIGALALLPATFLLLSQQRAGGVLPDSMLIFYKDDLVAACLAAAVFLTFSAMPGRRWMQAGAAAGLQVVLLGIQSSRAAVVALATSSVWWVVAQRWNYFKMQAGLFALGATAMVAVASAGKGPESRFAEIGMRMASIVDFSGTGAYAREEHGYLSDNNRFRIVWWREVATEVAETNILTGLGFGHDLSRGFLQVYDQDLGEQFSARSPHSIVFTTFGRMGLVGLATWLGLVGAMVAATLAAARRAREEDAAPLAWWSAAWVLLVSACFGVVLEGPMGAVLFWSLLGIANQLGRSSREAAPAHPA